MAIDLDLFGTAVTFGETVGASAGFAWLHGKQGTMPKVAGVDADVLAAISFHALGFLAVGAKMVSKETAAHAHNLGNGAAAYALSYWAAKKGQKSFNDNGPLFDTDTLKKGQKPAAPVGGDKSLVLMGAYDYRQLGAGPIRQQPAMQPSKFSTTGVYGY